MKLLSTLHLVSHAAVPALVAWIMFRPRWPQAWLLMFATMAIDADHLLADPVYDPNRCSVGFHPLHTAPAVGAYVVLSALPATRIVGLGLVIHIALDLSDCGIQRLEWR